MFHDLRIQNFRLFEDLQINGLSRINLLGGRNNSGKTTVLEAVFLLCGGGNPELVLRINAFRGLSQVQRSPAGLSSSCWKPLFARLDLHRPISIGGRHDHGRLELTVALEPTNTFELTQRPAGDPSRQDQSMIGNLQGATGATGATGPTSREGQSMIANLQEDAALRTSGERSAPATLRLSCVQDGNKREEGRMRVTEQGTIEVKRPSSALPFQGAFLSARNGNLQEDAVRLGQLRTQKRGDLLTQALRIIEPRLQSVEDSSASGLPMIWGDIGLPELVPLPAMGEGLSRVARIVLAISGERGGVVLVDEIENGIHHSVMDKVWAVLAEAAQQFDTQILATTHSFECVAAASRALGRDWSYHRLDRNEDGKFHHVRYAPDEVVSAVDHGLEVR